MSLAALCSSVRVSARHVRQAYAMLSASRQAMLCESGVIRQKMASASAQTTPIDNQRCYAAVCRSARRGKQYRQVRRAARKQWRTGKMMAVLTTPRHRARRDAAPTGSHRDTYAASEGFFFFFFFSSTTSIHCPPLREWRRMPRRPRMGLHRRPSQVNALLDIE